MSELLNSAGRKLFAAHLEQYAPVDPMYEYYTDKKGRKKKKKRELPPGLSARDAKILKSVKRRAHYLDKGFNLCGMRFGWTFIIGIIPGAGDVADVALNYLLVVRKAQQAEIPSWLLRKMLMNNAVSAGVGFMPVAGDVILAMFKANSRNAALLEEFLRIRVEHYVQAGLTAEQIAQMENEKKSPLSGRGDRKGKGKGKDMVKGVNVNDAMVVKPGAGKEDGEVVPGATNGKGGAKSLFGSRKKKSTADTTASPKEGRFVEQVSSS